MLNNIILCLHIILLIAAICISVFRMFCMYNNSKIGEQIKRLIIETPWIKINSNLHIKREQTKLTDKRAR